MVLVDSTNAPGNYRTLTYFLAVLRSLPHIFGLLNDHANGHHSTQLRGIRMASGHKEYAVSFKRTLKSARASSNCFLISDILSGSRKKVRNRLNRLWWCKVSISAPISSKILCSRPIINDQSGENFLKVYLQAQFLHLFYYIGPRLRGIR